MDSFYDAPRQPPAPFARETLAAVPVVPEISVLCSSNAPRNAFTPYNQWKHQQNPLENNVFGSNKENVNSYMQNLQNNNSILKKQVRFQSPVLQQRPPEPKKTDFNQQHDSKAQEMNINRNIAPRIGSTGPSFEQMYMANIPNRQLDLSIIDLPKRVLPNTTTANQVNDNTNTPQQSKPREIQKKTPKTYKEFLESQKSANKLVLNDSVTDIFNYRKPSTCSPKIQPVFTTSHDVQKSSVPQHYKSPSKPPNPTDPIVYKNSNPATTEKYFQGVSQAISQRSTDRATQAPKIFESQTENVVNLEQPSTTLKTYLQRKKTTSIDDSPSHNRLNTVQSYGKNTINGEEYIVKTYTDFRGINCATSDPHSKPRTQYIYEGSEFHRQNVKNIQNNDETTSKTNDNHYHLHNKDGFYDQNVQEFLGYKEPFPEKALGAEQKCVCCTKSPNSPKENNALQLKSDNDFSAKDLLKIIAQQGQQIAQQNNQLLQLQQQVSEIALMHKNTDIYRQQKSIENGQKAQPCCAQENNEQYCRKQITDDNILVDQNIDGATRRRNVEQHIQERCITSTQHEQLVNAQVATPRKNKNHLPNFSIGLTTSFEVSFRRPPHRNQTEFHQKPGNKRLDYEPEPPRIQEVTETESTGTGRNCRDDPIERFGDRFGSERDNKETLVDTSMVFREPIRVRETCPSPEPSIKINMADFDESDSDDGSLQVEGSFYRNLMGQVNKILQKAQIETAEELAFNMAEPTLNNRTMNKVKEATLKHLRRIGVNMPNFEDSSQNSSSSGETDGRSYNQDDISFAVKQLLMKYLPADHLAKLATKEDQHNDRASAQKDKIGAIKTRPEFSFATVQYMKKYNLIANNQKDFKQPQRQNPLQSPKILDISKLKQQPKLL